MIAFAANSLLCRVALMRGLIDPLSFASLRITSGAVVLLLIVGMRKGRAGPIPAGGSWRAAASLAIYVACFSYAYLRLDTGTGALILFGAVQATMLYAAWRAGERLGAPRILAGLVLAICGFAYLVSPGLSAPPPLSAALMLLAGWGWGVYSLQGHGAADPLASTAGNFIKTVPLILSISIAAGLLSGFLPGAGLEPHWTASGVALALVSGGGTSALGYIIWYAVLHELRSSQAAVVQLSVPPLAAAGGALIAGEAVSMRLVLASVAILGGIWMVLSSRSR